VRNGGDGHERCLAGAGEVPQVRSPRWLSLVPYNVLGLMQVVGGGRGGSYRVARVGEVVRGVSGGAARRGLVTVEGCTYHTLALVSRRACPTRGARTRLVRFMSPVRTVGTCIPRGFTVLVISGRRYPTGASNVGKR